MKRVIGRKPSLLTSFSLLGILFTSVTAIFFAWSFGHQLEQNALQGAAEKANYQLIQILSPTINQVDLSTPFDFSHYTQIDALIRKNILTDKNIVSVKIWNMDGLLLYSDDKKLEGQYFAVDDELEKALEGEITMGISTLNNPYQIGKIDLYDRLLEIYIPIQLEGSNKIVGAYEIYHDLVELEQVINDTRRLVWISVGLGFLVLYGSLFTLVRSASRKLVTQGERNKFLYEQEQIRSAELNALYDLSRTLADAHDFDTILNLINQCAVKTVQVTFSRIALIEENKLIVRAANPTRILDYSLNFGKQVSLSSTIQSVLEQNTPIVISSDSPDLSDSERKTLFLGDTKYLCFVSLRAGNRVLGLLMLGEMRSMEREPFSLDKIRLARNIGDQAASALRRVELFLQLEESYFETVRALASAVETRDPYTAGHQARMVDLAAAIATEMDCSRDQVMGIRMAGIIHDLGKLKVPAEILSKPGKLTELEFSLVKTHPQVGFDLLKDSEFPWPIAEMVLQHHEKMNGSGYPQGLKGDDILLEARILAVADIVEAMSSHRPYRPALGIEKALNQIMLDKGTLLDPDVVDACLRVFEDGYVFPRN